MPRFGHNACCATLRCSCLHCSTAFTNSLESARFILAFCSSTALNLRSKSSLAEIGQEVVVEVGLVRIVVKGTLAAFAGVGIVGNDMIRMGLHKYSFATRSNTAAFCTGPSCPRKVTVGLMIAMVRKPLEVLRSRQRHCGLQERLAIPSCHQSLCLTLIQCLIGWPAKPGPTLWTMFCLLDDSAKGRIQATDSAMGIVERKLHLEAGVGMEVDFLRKLTKAGWMEVKDIGRT